jgi:iron complex outermembrane recepter protein
VMKGVLRGLTACALASLVARVSAETLSDEYNLDIAPLPLSAALKEFSRQTGLQVGYLPRGAAADSAAAPEASAPRDDFRMLRSDVDAATQSAAPPVRGQFTAEAALLHLLNGTELTYEFVNERTVAIVGRSAEHSPNGARAGEVGPAAAARAKGAERVGIGAAREPRSQPAIRAAAPDGDGKRVRRALEEVVVTARKHDERSFDIPISVTTLPADRLAKGGAARFVDLADKVPGLTFQTSGPGLTQIALRGVTIGADAGATVGIQVDDVPYGSSASFVRSGQLALDAGLFDVDRIEVLRGPQSTLYGTGAMAGLIKWVTKQPDTSRLGGELRAGYSHTQEGSAGYNVAGVVNVPFENETAAVRASGFYTRDGGYIDNVALDRKDVNSSDIYGGRLDLLLTPTDAWGIRLSGLVQDIARDGFPLADYHATGAPVDGSLMQRRSFAETFEQRFGLVSATVSYDLAALSLRSISSYQTLRTASLGDNTGSFLALARTFNPAVAATALADYAATEKLTQEVRLAVAGPRTFEWQLGGFYTHESSSFRQQLELRDSAGRPLPEDVFAFSAPTHYEESAAFGDLTWHLTDRFDMTGGLRYTRARSSYVQTGGGALGLSAPGTRAVDDAVTYLANAHYHFSDQATGYLRYATGYRPGGPNFMIPGLAPEESTFEPDRLKSYEAGLKADLFDARLQIDVAAYYIRWSNIIVTLAREGFAAKANVPGGARIRGAELSVVARPASALILTGAFACQHAALAEADPILHGAEGERLPNVPNFTATLGVSYELPMADLRPTIGAAVSYMGERTAAYNDSPPSDPQYHLPAYTAFDLSAGFTLGAAHAQLYVRNLFDERRQVLPWLPGASAFSGQVPISILPPRTVGVTVSTEF